MKPLGFLSALLLSFPLVAQQLPVTTVTPNTLQHTVMAPITGNQSRIITVLNGATRHQITFQSGPLTSSTFTVYGSNNSSPNFNQVGQSILNDDTVTFYGIFDQLKITTTNYTGTGEINADYYGDAPGSQSMSLTAAPFNTAIGAVGDALKVTVAAAPAGTVGANVNVAQINGVTPLMGNGVTGTGSPRVTIASDNTAFAVNAAGLPSSSSANAVSMVQSTAYEASHVGKASAGNLYGIFGYSSKASAQWIQCYNSATVPADTAVPIITFSVPATSNFSLSTGTLPINLSTGIACANSSTGPTKTVGSADTWFNILYN